MLGTYGARGWLYWATIIALSVPVTTMVGRAAKSKVLFLRDDGAKWSRSDDGHREEPLFKHQRRYFQILSTHPRSLDRSGPGQTA